MVGVAGMLAAALSIACHSVQARAAGIFGVRLARFSGAVAVVLLASVAFVPIVALLIWLVAVTVTLTARAPARSAFLPAVATGLPRRPPSSAAIVLHRYRRSPEMPTRTVAIIVALGSIAIAVPIAQGAPPKHQLELTIKDATITSQRVARATRKPRPDSSPANRSERRRIDHRQGHGRHQHDDHLCRHDHDLHQTRNHLRPHRISD